MLRSVFGRIVLAGVASTALLGCAAYSPSATFQDGVELVPGPAHFVIRIEPPEASPRVAFSGYGDTVVLFAASHGDERYLLGTDLPSTLQARVDGHDCTGSIEMVTDMEYDGTLRIDRDTCSLTLDRSHPTGAVEHDLVDDGPVAS
jgi:hypothetical protein